MIFPLEYGIILVCGGREYTEKLRVHEILTPYKHPKTYIIHGAARGADTLAEKWAKANEINYRGYPAKWNLYGKKAGYLRNKEMLDDNPVIDLCIAFPGGRGTQMMVDLARGRGIEVIEVD